MRILHSIIFCLAAALPLLVASCSHSDPRTQALVDLRGNIEDELEELNPGDWILICPTEAMKLAVSLPEPEQISTQTTTVNALRETLDLMESEGMLSPRIWTCRELENTTSRRKPGNARLRNNLKDLLSGRQHFSVEERIITMQLSLLRPPQQILYLQTNTTQPHSAIAIELDYAGSNAVPHKKTQQKTPYRHADLKP